MHRCAGKSPGQLAHSRPRRANSLLGGKYRIDAGCHLEGFLDIGGQSRGSTLTEVRAEQDEILLLAPGVCQGKPLGPDVRTKAKARSPIRPAKPTKACATSSPAILLTG
jgi:hypothetical protein